MISVVWASLPGVTVIIVGDGQARQSAQRPYNVRS